jgi:S-adenosylmethionine/arginine decarboxylase-like enzyme
MCGDAKPHLAIGVLKEAFEAKDVVVKEHLRGEELEQLKWQAAARKKAAARLPKREKERRVKAA